MAESAHVALEREKVKIDQGSYEPDKETMPVTFLYLQDRYTYSASFSVYVCFRFLRHSIMKLVCFVAVETFH